MAEQCVQIFKKSMKKITSGTLDERLSNILFTYRTTPQFTAELMFGRCIRTEFDLLNPSDFKELTAQNQSKKKIVQDLLQIFIRGRGGYQQK